MRDGNLFAEQCPSREVLKHVTSRWGVLIPVALRRGRIASAICAARWAASARRCWLSLYRRWNIDGFVDRVSYPVVPPHVEYSLTPLGGR